jgi:N-acyl-L-homoserine lactone synthetase
MIRVIKGFRPAEPLLASMFLDRKRLFVDLLGWNVPVVDDRFEIDRFDHAHAVYIVAIDEDGGHEGSLRLLPTCLPHILDTLFAPLCAAGAPMGEDIFEITRLCLPSRLGAARRLEVRNRLISAMVDYAMSTGITRLTGVVEDRFRKDILAMGWLAEPIGPARRIDGGLLGAFAIHLAADTPARLRWTGIYQDVAGMNAASVAA